MVSSSRPVSTTNGTRGAAARGPAYRFQSLGIGQPQIEQDTVNRILRQILLGFSHARHVYQFGIVQALLVEHLAE